MKRVYFKPTPLLQPYIERYWSWESTNNSPMEMPPMLPGTGTELLFHLGNPFSIYTDNSGTHTTSRSHIICTRKESYIQDTVTNPAFIAVRFRIGAFRHFYRDSLKEIPLSRPLNSIEELWGNEGKEIEERVNMAPSMEQRIRLIEEWLLDLFLRYEKQNRKMDLLINDMYYHCGSFKLGESASVLETSPRQFERVFNELVGVTPKRLHRNARFERTLKTLLLNKSTDYLPVALSHGYYDQSHFIREFKSYTGESPGKFLKEKNFMSHFYNNPL